METSSTLPFTLPSRSPAFAEELLPGHLPLLEGRISIVAGHYCLAEELAELSHDGPSEIESFRYGATLHRAARDRGLPSNLVLFINDIGITSEARRTLIDGYRLPENYREILRERELGADDVEIIFESALRNRASKEIRKRKKSDPAIFQILPSNDPRLVRCVDAAAACEIPSGEKSAITILGPDREPLVVKEGSNPKCNAILATLFQHIRSNHRSDTCINCFNVIYVNRINLGIHVANSVFDNSIEHVNLFFDENGVLPWEAPLTTAQT